MQGRCYAGDDHLLLCVEVAVSIGDLLCDLQCLSAGIRCSEELRQGGNRLVPVQLEQPALLDDHSLISAARDLL